MTPHFFRRHPLPALLCALLCALTGTVQATDCPPLQTAATSSRLEVSNKPLRTLTPQFFGFNLELIEFQNSMWNRQSQQLERGVLELLQRFPGAMYRYPGGSVSNHFDWKAATGPLAQRPAQQLVDYQAALPVAFGPREYLEFIKQVKGTAWYVLNLQGSLKAPLPTDTLARSATELAGWMQEAQRQGLPAVYRWELGNELDRGHHKWSADQYAKVAKQLRAAVQAHSAPTVGMVQDWSHTGRSLFGKNYNQSTAEQLQPATREFSAHLYYDGEPWGPPVPKVLTQLCKNGQSLRAGNPQASLWLTELGRAPQGTPADANWKSNWRQSADLQAAISMADMLIQLARTPGVNGAFMHSLHASRGPWPLLHTQANGSIHPGTVYWALVLLRETLQEQVLQDSAGSAISTSVVLSDAKRSRYSVWNANRAATPASTVLRIPALAGRTVEVKLATLSSASPQDHNYSEPYKVFPQRKTLTASFNAQGEWTLQTPAYSVNALTLE